MKFKKKILFTIKLYFLLIFLFSLVACQGSLFSYRGRTVEPDRRIELLENGPHEGIWQTNDLTIKYRYEKKADIMQLSGVAELSDRYKFFDEVVERFYLTLFFLDNKDRVLEDKEILHSSYSLPYDKFTFKKSIEIPPSVISIAYHYQLRVRIGR
jgi:hypothetical protein